MFPGILPLLPGNISSFPGPSYQPGMWFYPLVFFAILLGSVFIITPLPENSLLFVAGAMAAGNQVSVEWLLAASIAGAYVGYDLNYWSARLLNLAVCRRTCPHVFRLNNMKKARELMEKFGPLSIVISRFIPAVNLPPFFAGLDSMNYIQYAAVNLIGAIAWCGITVFLGYYIGSIDIIQNYVNLLFELVVLALIITLAYAVVTLARRWGKDDENSA